MADCEYQIAGDDRIYSESEFKKLLSEGYLDKVMLENQVKVRGIKPNEELAKSFQIPSAIQPAAEVKTEETVTPVAEVKTEEVTPTETPQAENIPSISLGKTKELTFDAPAGFKNELLNLGYTEADISNMTIEQQQDIVIKQTQAPKVESTAKIDSVKENERQERIAQMQKELDDQAPQTATPTETVTKTEEKVTEPIAEVKEEAKQPTREAVAAKNLAD